MANKKQDVTNKPKKLKWDPFSLRNPKYIQDTRKEVLQSIGVLSPWQKFLNFPKKLIRTVAIKKEEARKRKELQKKKNIQKALKIKEAKIRLKIKQEKEKKEKLKRKAQDLIKLKKSKAQKVKSSKKDNNFLRSLFSRSKTAAVIKKAEKGKQDKKTPGTSPKTGQDNKQENKERKEKAEARIKKKKQELEFLKAKEKELKKVKWTSPDILKTNLVKDNVVTFINWKKNMTLLIAGVLISILIVVGVYQRVVIEKQQMQTAEEILLDKINKINRKIELAERNIREVTIFQSKLNLIEQLLDKHIYWTNFFKFLEDVTIEDIYYSNFSGDTNGIYTLSASAESFNMLAKQIEELRTNENINLATTNGGSVGGAEGGGSRVSFVLQLEINPEIFYR